MTTGPASAVLPISNQIPQFLEFLIFYLLSLVSYDTIRTFFRKQMNDKPQIPSEWVRIVCDILDARKKTSYRITTRARNDFEALFPDLFSEEMLAIMSDVLRCDKYTDFRYAIGIDPKGYAYEFLFPFRDRPMYGKINLKDNKVFVEVISAHLQQKGDIENGRFL